MRIVIGITGASGVIYGIKLLEYLTNNRPEIEKFVIISEVGKQLIKFETTYTLDDIKKLSNFYYENTELDAPISSDRGKFDCMVIVPCSMSTLSKIGNGISDNLITRISAVCLKEKIKLILVPRETPISQIHLENMLKLSQCGVIILPAMPGFYHRPKNIDDMINFILGKILDILGIENDLYNRWAVI